MKTSAVRMIMLRAAARELRFSLVRRCSPVVRNGLVNVVRVILQSSRRHCSVNGTQEPHCKLQQAEALTSGIRTQLGTGRWLECLSSSLHLYIAVGGPFRR
eukprot:3138872-Prymnesium_polylepis.1